VHTRRIATFLLGAWMGGCLFMGVIEIQNLRSPALVMNAPPAPAEKMIQTLGHDPAQLLLRYLAAQQNRHYSSVWEMVQIPLGLAVGLCLFFATQRRLLPLLLCALMLGLLLFQYFTITPELAFRGPETDFPPGNAAVGPMARMWALQQVYAGVEIAKLIAGGVLATYLFLLRTLRRRRSRETDSIDHTYHGHINR
jgi:hypothetical protein